MATRLAVLPVPMFVSGKLTVTVSSRIWSCRCRGAQLSFVTVTGGADRISGVPGTPQQANRWRAISSVSATDHPDVHGPGVGLFSISSCPFKRLAVECPIEAIRA